MLNCNSQPSLAKALPPMALGHWSGLCTCCDCIVLNLPSVWTVGTLLGYLQMSICLFLLYVLATSKVISGWILTFHSNHSLHWETSPPGPCPDIPLNPIICANQSLPYPNSIVHLARKWQVYIFKSLIWFDQGTNLWGQNPTFSQNQRRTLSTSIVTV